METKNTVQKTMANENKFPFQALLMLGVMILAVVMLFLKFTGIL